MDLLDLYVKLWNIESDGKLDVSVRIKRSYGSDKRYGGPEGKFDSDVKVTCGSVEWNRLKL